MATPNFTPSVVSAQSSKVTRSIITIRGRAFAVRFQGNRVDVYSAAGGWWHFNSHTEFKAWRTDRMIAFRELDAMFGGEAARVSTELRTELWRLERAVRKLEKACRQYRRRNVRTGRASGKGYG